MERLLLKYNVAAVSRRRPDASRIKAASPTLTSAANMSSAQRLLSPSLLSLSVVVHSMQSTRFSTARNTPSG